MRATVVEDLGAEAHVIFAIDAPRVVAEAVRAAEDAAEATEGLLADDDRALFTARVDGQLAVAPGTELELAVDPRADAFLRCDDRRSARPLVDRSRRGLEH